MQVKEVEAAAERAAAQSAAIIEEAMAQAEEARAAPSRTRRAGCAASPRPSQHASP